MNNIYDYYKKNKNNTNIYKESYDYFYKKYIELDPSLYNFKLNINEKLKNTIKQPIPGKIYTFFYNPLYKDILDYYDKRPILFLIKEPWFCKNTKNFIISGLNLNFLPETIRLFILDRYYKLFNKEINEEINEYRRNKLKVFFLRILSFLRNNNNSMKIIFEQKRYNYMFAYRRYIISRIININMIEYDDWHIIPFLKTKDLVGKSLDEIIKEYFESLIKNKYKK